MSPTSYRTAPPRVDTSPERAGWPARGAAQGWHTGGRLSNRGRRPQTGSTGRADGSAGAGTTVAAATAGTVRPRSRGTEKVTAAAPAISTAASQKGQWTPTCSKTAPAQIGP